MEGEGDEYISFTAMDDADESAVDVDEDAPKMRRLGLSQEGTPTFHELVDSLDGEDTLGCEDEVKVDGGYVCCVSGRDCWVAPAGDMGSEYVCGTLGLFGLDVTGTNDDGPR